MAKAGKPHHEPKPRVKRQSLPKPRHGPPSRASVVKTILDDLTSPMTPADAAELYAVSVMDRLSKLAPEVMPKFTPEWGNVFIDLAIAVINRCDEEDLRRTLAQMDEEDKAGEERDGLTFRMLRRRFARSLPTTVEPQIDSVGRYWLSIAAIEAFRAAGRDDELWEALWGRKTGWFPVRMLAREAPGTKPLGEDGVVEPAEEDEE